MPTHYTTYKIFIASPSGLEKERLHFRDIVNQYNENEANYRSVHFKVVGWEDVPGGVGRPQEIINKHLEECDYFALVLHHRWGTAPSAEVHPQYSSGSEEEFEVAIKCLDSADHSMGDLVVFFKKVSPKDITIVGDQHRAVLEFKSKLSNEKRLLFKEFGTLRQFEQLWQKHLAKWLRDSEPGSHVPSGAAVLAKEILRKNRRPTASAEHMDVKERRFQGVEAAIQRVTDLAAQGSSIAQKAVSSAWLKHDLAPIQSSLQNVIKSKQVSSAESSRVNAELAAIAEARGDFDMAVSSVESILLKEPNNVAAVIELARLNVRLEKYSRALVLIQPVVENIDKKLKIYRIALALRGATLVRHGKYDDARVVYLELLHLSRDAGDAEGVSDCLFSLSGLEYEAGNYEKSADYANQCISEAQTAGFIGIVTSAIGGLGLSRLRMGEIDEAERLFVLALELYERRQDTVNTAATLCNRSLLELRRGRPSEALKYAEQSIAVAKANKQRTSLATASANIGLAYWYMGNLDKAEVHLQYASVSLQEVEVFRRATQAREWVESIRLRRSPPDISELG